MVYLQHEEIDPEEWGLIWMMTAPISLTAGKPWLASRSVTSWLRLAREACFREGWKKWGGPR